MKKSFLIITLITISFLKLGEIIMLAQEKNINYEFTVNTSSSEIYNAWTTTEGIKTFFAPDGSIDLNLFGDYFIYFFPENEPGSRGAENEKIISFEEGKMVSFTWGFPPSLPELRANQKTIITIRFEKIDNGKTKVYFTQSGWGESEDWQKGYNYFVNAWGKIVLPRLIYRFDVAPIDWENIPDLENYFLIK